MSATNSLQDLVVGQIAIGSETQAWAALLDSIVSGGIDASVLAAFPNANNAFSSFPQISADGSIAFGFNSFTDSGQGSVAIGYNASAAGGGISIGGGSPVASGGGICIGSNSDALLGATVIGEGYAGTTGAVVLIGDASGTAQMIINGSGNSMINGNAFFGGGGLLYGGGEQLCDGSGNLYSSNTTVICDASGNINGSSINVSSFQVIDSGGVLHIGMNQPLYDANGLSGSSGQVLTIDPSAGVPYWSYPTITGFDTDAWTANASGGDKTVSVQNFSASGFTGTMATALNTVSPGTGTFFAAQAQQVQDLTNKLQAIEITLASGLLPNN